MYLNKAKSWFASAQMTLGALAGNFTYINLNKECFNLSLSIFLATQRGFIATVYCRYDNILGKTK
jgi:hypothetical protein